jgi:hypothetical protein
LDARRSHRFFAKRLGWPSSYLADVCAGRRQLSIVKAVEFSTFMRMSGTDSERLMTMVLCELAQDESTKRYLRQSLQRAHSVAYGDATVTAKDALNDMESMAVFNLLLWSRRLLRPEVICRLLYTFKNLTPERVDAAVQRLMAAGVIAVTADGGLAFNIENVEIFDGSSQDPMEYYRSAARNFMQWCTTFKDPAFHTSGVALLSKTHFLEARRRMIKMLHWLGEAENASKEDVRSGAGECLPFQFDLNLFCLLDRDFDV